MKLTKKQQKEIKEIKELIKDRKRFYDLSLDERINILKKQTELQYIDNMKYVYFRLKNDDHKYYFANQLKEFKCNVRKYGYENIKPDKIKRVVFYSNYFQIENNKLCIDKEKGFYDKYELLGFIVGYNKGLGHAWAITNEKRA